MGIKITYVEQKEPRGLPDAFIVGKKFIGIENVALILGDNFFYGQSLTNILKGCLKINNGATVILHPVRNPSLYELYGSDNYGISGNVNLNPEKSETNELYGEYNFSEKLKFSSTAYRTTVLDQIETNSAYSQH